MADDLVVTSRPARDPKVCRLGYLLDVQRLERIIARVDRRAALAYKRGDADGIVGPHAVIRAMIESVEILEWVAPLRARGQHWSLIGEALSMLKTAHAAEAKRPRDGATGVAYVRRKMKGRSPACVAMRNYDRTVREPALDDLVRGVVRWPRGIGTEALRSAKTRGKAVPADHPLVRFVRLVLNERSAPGSFADAVREYESGRRPR
jgi:hypothetical protein